MLRRRPRPSSEPYLGAWLALAPALDGALRTRGSVRREPRLLAEPWTRAQLDWLLLFEPELQAAQTLYRCLAAGARLSDEEIGPARAVVTKLAATLERARALTAA